MTIGERVAAWRRARGWSRGRLAETLGLSRVSVWRIEDGEQGPSADQVHRIAAALGLESVADFYGEVFVTPEGAN